MQGQESIKHKSLETHLVTSGLWVFQTSYTLAQARRPDQGWTFLVLCCWSFSLFVTFFPFAFKASKINHSLGVCTHQHPMANRHHTLKYMVFFFCFVLFALTFLNAKNMWYLQDWKKSRKDKSVRWKWLWNVYKYVMTTRRVLHDAGTHLKLDTSGSYYPEWVCGVFRLVNYSCIICAWTHWWSTAHQCS